MKTVIKGMGSALPAKVVTNDAFLKYQFYDEKGQLNPKNGAEIVAKLETITGIRERRYVPEGQDSVPLMTEAAKNAIFDAGLDKNQIQGIIVAHNAGNMLIGEKGFHTVPNLAAHLKHTLEITNYECFAYDILFGCPGWIQGLIQAHQAIQNGDAEHILVVGLEIASRLLDPHDLNSMIFADGCGACIVSKSTNSTENKGIISYATFSHAQNDLMSIHLGKSNLATTAGSCYAKMDGREVYKYATTWLPIVIKKALDKANVSISEVDMFLFHQANEKMLAAIANNLADLCEVNIATFENKIPMTIQFLGNTSVATIPTMMDLILKKQLSPFTIKEGNVLVMASVGAGMHCNALIYKY